MLKTIVVGFNATNCYLYAPDEKNTLIIDPGFEGDRILEELRSNNLTANAIVLTHGHIDHILGINEILGVLDIPIFMGKGDAQLLGKGSSQIHNSITRAVDRSLLVALDDQQMPPAATRYLSDGDVLEEYAMEIWETPGHSPGGISLISNGLVFTGDTLFAGAVGRDDLWRGNWKTIMSSLNRLMTLPDETQVYPGHGPSTSIGIERATNPYYEAH